MNKKTRGQLEGNFQNGDKPTKQHFVEVFASGINQKSDKIYVDSNQNVGIGTETPQAFLHVYDTRNQAIGEAGYQPTLMLGRKDGLSLQFDTNEISARKAGGDPTSLKIQREGGDVRFYDKDNDDKTIIFKDSGKVGIGNSEPLGKLHVTGADQDFVVKHNGKVGIGTTDPQALLHLNFSGDRVKDDEIGAAFMIGDAATLNLSFDKNEIMAKNGAAVSDLHLNAENGTVVVSGSMVYASDRKLKKDIKPLEMGLKELLKLKPVSYKWKSDKKEDLKYGFIAQDVEKILKEITYVNEKYNNKGISYIELVPVLTKAIQEQQTQIKSLETRLAKLEKLVQKK